MQLILSGEQAYRAFMAEHHSAEQMHHLQALVQNIIAGVQFAACIAALVFTVFAPLTPIVSGACAVLAVSLIVSVMAWRLIPHENKLAIKSFFGFAKPVVEKTDNSDIGKIVPAVTLHSRSEPVKNQEIVAPSAINGIRFFKSELVSCKCSGPIQEEPVLSAP